LREGEIGQRKDWNCVGTLGQKKFSELVRVAERIRGVKSLLEEKPRLRESLG